MNFIFNAVYQDYTAKITKNIIKEFSRADSLFLVVKEERFKDYFEDVKYSEIYYHAPCLHAEYTGKIYSNRLIPLDNDLLTKFAPYMPIALKMCERIRGFSERFEDRMRLVESSLAYWNTVLENNKIDCYISYDIPHEIYDYVIYALCKIKGIPCRFNRISVAVGQSYIMGDVENCCPQIEPIIEKLNILYRDTPIDDIPLDGEYKAYFEKQTSGKNLTPFYMKGTEPVVMLKGMDRAKNAVKLISKTKGKVVLDYFKFKKLKNEYNKTPTGEYFAKWNENCGQIDLSKKYIYFPLHMQPEATTCPQGGWFVWQLNAIKMLRYAFPNEVAIYVKENPKQTILSRGIEFIDQINEIENVHLVPKEFDTYRLMDNCIAVASVTGTALMEGLFKGKIGLMFGDYITKYAPGIYNIRTNRQCRKAAEEIMNGAAAPSHKELKIFIKAVEQVCHLGFSHYNPVQEKITQEQLVESMTNAFVNYIKTNC